MNRYENGKIYSLVCNTTGLTYIGSTTNTLERRLSKHKANHKRGYYISNREIFDNGNFSINLLEEYPCNNSEELRIREQYYIDTIPCVNRNSAYSTPEIHKQQIRQWHEVHREEMLEYKRNRYRNNRIFTTCGCGSHFLLHNRRIHNNTRKHITYLDTIQEEIEVE